MGTMAETVANRELVVYALALMGGETKRIHTEDIAVKCHEFFPESFSWTKYSEYPDKDIVRVALTDARKSQHGGFVDGRSGQKLGHSSKTRREPALDGWMLTKEGIDWVKKNTTRLEKLVGSGAIKEHRQKVLQQLRKIRQHPLFERYRDNTDRFSASIGEVADLVRCRVDAESSVWMKRFDSIKRKAQIAEQVDVADFIDRCEESYMNQR